MAYGCDDCGDEFDTLTRLRLHECPSNNRTATAAASSTDETVDAGGPPSTDSGLDRRKLERKYPDLVGDLSEIIEDTRNGGLSELAGAIAQYEQVLTRVSGGDSPGGDDLYRNLLHAYYEPLADSLDTAAQSQGWDLLVEFAEVYNPGEEEEFPEVGHVIANAIGRSVIRTRRTEGVDAIPATALGFLGTIPEYVDEFDIAYEESYTYGWGINHPEEPVSEHLLGLARTDPKFVKIALNTAFYVDQHAALDVFGIIVTDDRISGTRDKLGIETDLTEFYFQAVATLETEKLLGPHAPPYWDGADDLPRVVDMAPDVKQRIRELAVETGIATELPAEWSLHDLDVGVMGELLELMNGRSDHT